MSAASSHAETRLALVRQQSMELALFEILGGWVQRVVEPELKLMIATHSRRHGEHWLALAGLLPSGSAPAGDEAAAAADRSATVAAVYRVVLPEVVTAYQDLLSSLGPLAGAPVRRVVDAIVADNHRQQADGVRLLATLGDRKEFGEPVSNQSGRGRSPVES